MTDSGVWRGLKATIEKQFPGTRCTGYRAGSKGSGGQPDYHSTGDAVDISPPRMEIFNWIASNYPTSNELIYTPAGSRQIKDGKPHLYSAGVAVGHFDHIHWANAKGGSPSGAPQPSGPTGNAFGGLTSFLTFFSNTGMWARVGVAIGAVIILLIALARLTGGKVDGMRAIKTAAKKVKNA